MPHRRSRFALLTDRRGIAASEYAIIIGFIITAVAAAYPVFGESLTTAMAIVVARM